MDIYIAGVVHIPKSRTDAPVLAIPSATAFSSSGPVRRLSRPIEIVTLLIFLLQCAAVNNAKAVPSAQAISGVRVMCVPMAFPRTSEPLFCIQVYSLSVHCDYSFAFSSSCMPRSIRYMGDIARKSSRTHSRIRLEAQAPISGYF